MDPSASVTSGEPTASSPSHSRSSRLRASWLFEPERLASVCLAAWLCRCGVLPPLETTIVFCLALGVDITTNLMRLLPRPRNVN